MAHPVMWFEVLGNDGEALRKFYAALFGWRYDTSSPPHYGLVDTGDTRGIPGGVGPQVSGTPSWTTFYVETSDVEASLTKAEQLGGKIIMPRTVRPDVTLGMFEDPEGHVIGLVEARAA